MIKIKKKCTKCKRILPLSEFSKDRTRKDGLQLLCKKCQTKYRRKIKLEAINVFGGQCIHIDKNGIQCSKNTTNNLKELDLIHPNDDGNKHRSLISNGEKGSSFYRALKERNWNTDGYVIQVMCRKHHVSLDKSGKKSYFYGKSGKLHPRYKEGKFDDPVWLKKKYKTMTLREIAKKCGVSYQTIKRRMVKFGLPRRKSCPRS